VIADSCTDRSSCIPGWITKLKAFYILNRSASLSLRQPYPFQESLSWKPTDSITRFLLEDEETTPLVPDNPNHSETHTSQNTSRWHPQSRRTQNGFTHPTPTLRHRKRALLKLLDPIHEGNSIHITCDMVDSWSVVVLGC
jgi:hypothetical protein